MQLTHHNIYLYNIFVYIHNNELHFHVSSFSYIYHLKDKNLQLIKQ